MDFIKKLFSAIFLSVLISMPLVFLEAFAIYTVALLYEIPYLKHFEYYQIVGLCFIIMMTRNRIKTKKETPNDEDFALDLFNNVVNRLFRVIFVWTIALVFHQLFLK